MLNAIVFGLAVGASIQAFRQWPADGPVTTDSAVVVLVAGMALAWLSGRLTGRSRGAVAVASATATAVSDVDVSSTNTVNVALVVPGAGAGSSVAFPEQLPWQVAGTVVTADQLDGIDLEDAGLVDDLVDELRPERDTA